MDAGTSRSKAIKLKKINHKWETGSGEVKETVQVRKMKRIQEDTEIARFFIHCVSLIKMKSVLCTGKNG